MVNESEVTKYISLFHSRDHAAETLKALEAAMIPRADTTVIGGNDNDKTYGDGYAYNAADHLATIGVPARDLKHLQDGIRNGGVVVVVEGVVDQQSAIEKIFHKYSANKIDETEVPVNKTDDFYDDAALTAAPLAAIPAIDTASTTTTESGVIPVIEEDLLVGKREVERGGVRVFSRMVEEPVSTDVTLREEHAVVERRPVDRAVTDADLRSGQVIELTETAEEAVVGKVARVVEEVYVGKQATEHTETVRDTVRHTEVDVEPIQTVTTERKTY